MKDWADADTVNMGDFRVVVGTGRLAVRGLGSCVAVVLYDPTTSVGGIAHVMLPSHTLARGQAKPAKFADTAIPLLLSEVMRLETRRENVTARLVGGARMFETVVLAGALHMGERNVVACRTAIRETGLVIAGEDVGGHRGRSLLFDVRDGTIAVRMLGEVERYV